MKINIFFKNINTQSLNDNNTGQSPTPVPIVITPDLQEPIYVGDPIEEVKKN